MHTVILPPSPRERKKEKNNKTKINKKKKHPTLLTSLTLIICEERVPNSLKPLYGAFLQFPK